ncbi:MAG: PAS domain S-box protein [Myxococcales bacterium]|nr:PAS domain S-box protein [Myxococcales bacterium]
MIWLYLCELALRILALSVSVRMIFRSNYRAVWVVNSLFLVLYATPSFLKLAAAVRGQPSVGSLMFAEVVELATSLLIFVTLLIAARVVNQNVARDKAHLSIMSRYDQVFTRAKDGIFIVDTSGRYVDANPAGLNMVGYSLEELRKLSVYDLVPEEEQVAQPVRMTEFRSLQDNQGLTSNRKLRRKDGSLIHVEIGVSRLLDGNALGIVRDIGVRIAAEEKLHRTTQLLQAMVESAPVAILLLDVHGKVQLWNAAAETMFGWKQEEVRGQPIRIVPDELWEEHLQFRRTMIEKGTRVSGVLTERLHKDGRRLQVRLETALVKGSDGEVIGLMGLLVDVSDQLRLEARVRRVERLEAIGQLAGGIAHDFNNMLTAIIGYSDLVVLESKNNAVVQHHIGNVLRAARRARELTQQLLAYGRRQVLQPRVLNLNRIVGDAEPILRRLIRENVTLRFINEYEDAIVRADPHQLHQVLLNLVVNAGDAIVDVGKIDVSVSVAENPGGEVPDGSYAVLKVQDDGYGMTDEVQKQLFEPFFTTKELGKGTGLGLATVYGIVRQSGGYVQVQSTVGVGSKFLVYLPLLTGVEADQTERSEIHVVTMPRGRHETLLVVEDEPSVRDYVAAVFQRTDYQAVTVGSAEEALPLFLAEPDRFQLLLTDVVLPGLNGCQLAERMRQIRSDLPVLFTSGYAESAKIGSQVLDERTQYLQKPYRIDELLQKVRELIENKVTESD